MNDTAGDSEWVARWIPAEVLIGCLIGLLTIEVAGCREQASSLPPRESGPPIEGLKPQATKAVEYELGEVSSDVVYDCIVGGSDTKVVEFVSRSCGCATVGLEKGDLVEFSKPFRVSVSLKGKPAGEGSQQVVVGFTDGSAFRARLRYDYRPPPSVSPQYLVFKASDKEKSVSFRFPGEAGVNVTTEEMPPYLAGSINSNRDGDNSEIVLKLEVDRSLLNGAKDGVIDIATSSDRQARFRVPYLILEN